MLMCVNDIWGMSLCKNSMKTNKNHLNKVYTEFLCKGLFFRSKLISSVHVL